MSPVQRAVVVLVSVMTGLVLVWGAIWLVAGDGRPTGGAIAVAGWILVAVLVAFGAVTIYLGKRRRR
ncbi:hypothetical protein [Micromonospora sp. NPDC023888]|uniref:hypothetical protein n=1 Tax=Micromonospora sp. NPDC023888 TaxID=3155607 RepID=UPI0033D4DD83